MQGGNTDRSNEAWLEELRFGTESEAALADLRALLRRGLVKALGDRRFTDADVEDFVQNAMIRVLANLDTFRGESRFTTWAMAVAVRVALG